MSKFDKSIIFQLLAVGLLVVWWTTLSLQGRQELFTSPSWLYIIPFALVLFYGGLFSYPNLYSVIASNILSVILFLLSFPLNNNDNFASGYFGYLFVMISVVELMLLVAITIYLSARLNQKRKQLNNVTQTSNL